MDKRRLSFIVVLSVFSIFFLIALQLYWINISVETQRQKFDQTVMDVMENVVRKIEKEEAITRVSSVILDENQFSQISFNDTVLNLKDGLIKANQFIESQNQVKTKTDELSLKFTKPEFNDSTFYFIRETKKNVLSSSVNTVYPDNDSFLQSEIKKKASLISNVVNEWALFSVNRNFEERIGYDLIDSLFYKELRAKGIKTDYVVDILDSETHSLSFSEDKDFDGALKNTPYSFQLFPNGFMESDALLIYFPNQDNYLIRNSWKVLLVSLLLICILIYLFYSSIATIYKQKKLSQVKNDFISNMTHEFKTPISTISLACEALGDNSIELDKSLKDSYLSMIKDENKRLAILVDNVLKSAAWDSSSLKLDIKKKNLHNIISEVIKNFEIQINNRGGSLNLNLNATNDSVLVDEVHMSNVIFNLLDNANKYSPEPPKIEVATINNKEDILLSIKDEGIGISKQEQKKIFDRFYRVSTGNIHDVKGFGLGLNYVKRIIDLHSGNIELESQKGKGTNIIIKLENHGKK